MTIYVVMIEDRHRDVEVHLFSDFKVALEYASEAATDLCRGSVHDPDHFDEEYRTPAPESTYKIHYYARYSTEGDSVTLLETVLDSEVE